MTDHLLPDERPVATRAAEGFAIHPSQAALLLDRLVKARANLARMTLLATIADDDLSSLFVNRSRPLLNLNDTFVRGADCEEVPWEDLPRLIELNRMDDQAGLILWAAKRRGYDIAAMSDDHRVPPRTRDILRKSREGQ